MTIIGNGKVSFANSLSPQSPGVTDGTWPLMLGAVFIIYRSESDLCESRSLSDGLLLRRWPALPRSGLQGSLDLNQRPVLGHVTSVDQSEASGSEQCHSL